MPTLYGRRIPDGWRQEAFGPAGYVYTFKQTDGSRMRIIETSADQDDGYEWQHVSVSIALPVTKDYRLPTWEDLAMCKRILMGHDTWAYEVIPPSSHHVSIHDYVLHIWRRVNGPSPIPDFSHGGVSI